jgi:hypothetical protein
MLVLRRHIFLLTLVIFSISCSSANLKATKRQLVEENVADEVSNSGASTTSESDSASSNNNDGASGSDSDADNAVPPSGGSGAGETTAGVTTPVPAPIIPNEVGDFTAATGTRTAAIDLSWDWPSDRSGYDTMSLRRAAGATAPIDCNAGDEVLALSAFPGTDYDYTDLTPAVESAFSYRLCICNEEGDCNTGVTDTNILSSGYIANLVGSAGGLIKDMALLGDTLYVAKSYAGLEAFDLTTPNGQNPLKFRYQTEGEAISVKADATHAFVADNRKGVKILDITTTPSTPILTSQFDRTDAIFDLQLNGNSVFITGGSSNGNNQQVQVTDRAAPIAYNANGGFLHYGAYSQASNRLYYGGDYFDPNTGLANPWDWKGNQTSFADTSYWRPRVFGNYLYLASAIDGFGVFDATTTGGALAALGTLGSLTDILDIHVKNDIAYVAGFDQISLVDITNKASPALHASPAISLLGWNSHLVGDANRMVVAGNGLNGIMSYSISGANASSPQVSSQYLNIPFASSIVVSGTMPTSEGILSIIGRGMISMAFTLLMLQIRQRP